MIKLNDTGLALGEIKQLLTTFNLPNCPVGEANKQPNKHYIDPSNSSIYFYKSDDGVTGTSQYIFPYIYNHKYDNLTSNLRVDSLKYDRYTHRYLGRYLRFIRDYKGVDLMSMYNCFDGEIYNSEISFTDVNGRTQLFDPTTENYIIYQIPITLQEYTLYVQSKLPVEMCVTIHNPANSTSENILKNLAKYTYRKYKAVKIQYITDLFTRYTDSSDDDIKEEWEQCLALLKAQGSKVRLLLRVPKSLDSSIALLEGIYYNDLISTGSSLSIPVRPQLLSYQNNISYLLADKMVAYLCGNVITPLSEDYEVKKIQDYITKNYTSYPQKRGIWTSTTTEGVKQIIVNNKLWETCYDVLPYCDRDVEKVLTGGIL